MDISIKVGDVTTPERRGLERREEPGSVQTSEAPGSSQSESLNTGLSQFVTNKVLILINIVN